MQRKQKQIPLVMALCLFVVMGCSGQFSSSNFPATEIEPVYLFQSAPNGLWQGDDISIAYTMEFSKPLFSLTGTLFLDSSVLMSFPVVRSFFLRIHFLDGDGNLLSTNSIPVNFSRGTFADDEYSISFSREIPPQVEAFSFSYSGTFSDYGERHPDTISIGY